MNTLVVYCHPDPASFTATVRDVAVAALAEAGHDVRVRDLYADGFEPRMSAVERMEHKQPGTRPELRAYADELRWCEHLVLVYPTWWSGHPAMLKGWIDRVWVRGVAWELPPGHNRIRGRLTNIRRLTAVTTHGSSKLVNMLEGEGGKRTLGRTLRVLCHPRAKTRWLALYRIDRASPDDRARFLGRVAATLGR